MNVLQKLSAYLYKRCGYANRKRDHRGLTIVELVCAIAILTLVGAGVSGVLVVSANTYRNGTTEVELQTEAQMIVNQIGDLIIDATKVEGSPTEDKASTITIEGHNQHFVVGLNHYNIDNNDVYKLEYSALGETQPMGENVTKFEADVSFFSSARSIRLYLELEKGTKSYAAYYTITARNGGYTVEEDDWTATVTIVAPSEIVVEPNQGQDPEHRYYLNATVLGISNTAVTWKLERNSDPNTQILMDEFGYYLSVGRNENSKTMVLTASTVEMDGTSPMAFTTVNVRLRRVFELKLNGVLISGEGMKAGATYRITPEFVGTTLQRLLGSESDMDYVDPYTLKWLDVKLTGVAGAPNEYYDFTIAPNGGYADLTLKKDLESGELIVSARALHPDGMNGETQTNKTGKSYVDAAVIGEWKLKPTSGWLRGGQSPVLSETLKDFNVEGKVWPSVVYYLDWDLLYVPGGDYDIKYVQQSSNNNVMMPDGRGRMVTWGGIITIFSPSNMADLKEGLVRSWYSYSSPYYDLTMSSPDSIYKLRLNLRADVGYGAEQKHHESTVEFEIPDVTISYRNSKPNDPDGAWSDDRGTHVVYVTDEDDIYTYISYFKLVDGWISEGQTYDLTIPGNRDSGIDWNNPIDYNDYILFNRFVGVIKDNDGFENDKRYDLTFVDANDRMYKNGLVPYMNYVTWENGHEVNEPLYNRLILVQEIGVTKDQLLTDMAKWSQYTSDGTSSSYNYTNLIDANLKTSVISRGENGQCTIAVFVTQDEKDMLCADGGTTITEIYEYNPMFCTNTLYTWGTQDWTRVQAERAESVDGCLGYLEYHFVQPNIELTKESSVKPLVMYCPTGAQPGLINGFYYIDETHRYRVNSTTAEYQINSGSGFTTQLMLTWNGSKWCD